MSSGLLTNLYAQVAVMSHLNPWKGELWDLKHTQIWKMNRYPLESCRPDVSRNQAAGHCQPIKTKDGGSYRALFQFPFSTLGNKSDLLRFSCIQVLSDSWSSPHHTGFLWKGSKRKWPKLEPQWSLLWFSYRGDQDTQQSSLLQSTCILSWDHGNSNTSTVPKTEWTKQPSTVQNWCLNTERKNRALPLEPYSHFRPVSPPAALPFLSPSSLPLWRLYKVDTHLSALPMEARSSQKPSSSPTDHPCPDPFTLG